VLASQAQAYVVYRAPKSGEPLRWCAASVGLRFSTVEPEGIAWEDARDVVHAAVEAWNAVAECSTPKLSFDGPSAVERIEPFDPCADNQNLVLFVHDAATWSNKGFSSAATAMTTLTFEDSLGVIADADIELNDASFAFSVGDPVPEDENDLLGTLVHEVGHLFGLDHSPEAEATMYYKAPAGEDKKRTLHEDDIDGVCWIYDYGCPSQIPPACPGGGGGEVPADAGSGPGVAVPDGAGGFDATAPSDLGAPADTPRPGVLVGARPSSDSNGCGAGGHTAPGAAVLALLALAAARRRTRPSAAAACRGALCSGR